MYTVYTAGIIHLYHNQNVINFVPLASVLQHICHGGFAKGQNIYLQYILVAAIHLY